MKNICIVVGARPNFIKVAPIIHAIRRAADGGVPVAYSLVYAGTEDDATLEPSLFDDLRIDRPNVYLGVECDSLNELVGKVMAAFEQYLASHPTDVVIVVDDLSSTMAAAIVTKKSGIQLAHLVAGTRSFDLKMPKEINRLVIDGLSDLLFTAGMSSNSIANKEGAELSKVYMVGNILMDTLRANHDRLKCPALMDTLHLTEGGYLVFTLNRKALIAHPDNLKRMVLSLAEAAGDTPVVAPLRAFSAAALTAFELPHNFHIVNPLGYLEFGWLTAHAKGVVTDSGNVAEEATFNGVPCITLNSYTEHLETVKVGTNELVGEDADKLAEAVGILMQGSWKKGALPDRWDGRSAERIVQILLQDK